MKTQLLNAGSIGLKATLIELSNGANIARTQVPSLALNYRDIPLVKTVSNHLPWSRSSVRRACDSVRIPCPEERHRGYIYHASFDDPALQAALLAPMPGAKAFEILRRQTVATEHVPSELVPRCAPLLTKQQEQHLFRQMNFLKHQAARLRDAFRLPDRPSEVVAAMTHHFNTAENLHRRAQTIRELLLDCNMRLVVYIAKRYVTPSDNLLDLVCEGNLVLVSAVDSFDFSLGHKFSTYASCILLNHFSRSTAREKLCRQRFASNQEIHLFEAAVDSRADERDCQESADEARSRVKQLLDCLDAREGQIIRLHFGLDNAPRRMTLENIGKQFGVTKQRVRQVLVRAMDKLRTLAVANSILLP